MSTEHIGNVVVWGVAAVALVVALGSSAAYSQEEERQEPKKKSKGSEPLILVMNYPYQITGTAKTRIHTVFFKPDFTPAVGAEVRINDKKMATADGNGTAIFEIVPGSNQSHKLTATLTEKDRRYRVVKHFAANARTESFRSDQLFVYTDRAVYNPGDDILVRVMAWELLGDYTAIKGAQVKLQLQTADGRLFGGDDLTTNEYGIAAARLPLAEQIPEGDFELVVLYRQAREVARLRIERFVPPVMELDHDIKRFLTSRQERLEIVVKLRYFAGGVPAGAGLKLTVRSHDGKELLTRPLVEESTGLFKLALTDKELDSIRRGTAAEQPFKMVLAATDSFGRTSEVTRDVVYTERPYRAVLELDKDDYPQGELVKLHAKVVDLDGKPARGIPLVCEVAAFKVKAEAVTDDAGVAEFSFTMGSSAGEAVVTSPLMAVPLASREVRFNQPKPMTSKVFDPPSRQGIQTRVKVTFDRRYRPIEKVVHVDFTDISGALVAATTIPVREEDGLWLAEGTVTADTWGTMLANLYVCAMETDKKKTAPNINNVGFITEGQHVTLYPDSQAEIIVEGLKPRVKPGERLDLTVRVKSRSGQEAALGAALVDRAVVSLMDPLEVTPVDHFYNPQRKVISTGGAGVLTWPVVDRNWGEPWRDIAYSNWGWKGPGALVREGSDAMGEEGGEGGAVSGVGSFDGGVAEGVAKGSGSVGVMMKSKKEVKASPMKLMAIDSDNGGYASPAAAEPPEEEKPADYFANGDPAQDGRRAGAGGEAKALAPVITIRTRFPETALWEPLLATRQGEARISLSFPDAITIQRLTLVASDKVGGLGLAHHQVEVRQEFFVQADLPPAMTLGDELKVVALVRNLSGQEAEVTVRPTASGLTFVGETERQVKVADGEAAALTWTVKAVFAGEAELAISASSAGYVDQEVRKVRVLPAGDPEVMVERSTIARDKSFSARVEVDGKAHHNAAFLNISFPTVIPALQAWEAASEMPLAAVGVSGVASRAILDGAMLSWARRTKQRQERVKALEERLARAGAELSAVQNSDGSWGWFYLADSSVNRSGYVINTYLSALALRALVEVAEAGRLPTTEPLSRGIAFLLDARNQDGLWSPGAYFWEVNANETDWGLSGDLFETIVRASAVVGGEPGKELLALGDRFAAHLASRPQEPAAVAHAIGALDRLARWQGDKKREEESRKRLEHLLSLKRDGYWEPHWYHAYGGQVELNARILELLETLGGERYVTVRHEVILYLLGTREAWGAWHNEIGTASAVRALLAAADGSGGEVAGATVVVRVNGAEVHRVRLDPEDPFHSAASLRFFEITRWLKAGANEVEVAYDGALQAPVSLTVKSWGGKAGGKQSAPPEKGRFTIRREAPEEAALGQPVTVRIDVTTSRAVAHVQVVDSLPSNTEVDKSSLDELVAGGKLLSYRIEEDQVALFLDRLQDEHTFTYRLTAARCGTALHRGASVLARFDREMKRGRVTGGELRVR